MIHSQLTQVAISTNTLPRVISLFSGAGGLDLGFEEVGFEIAFAVDVDQWAVATHKQRFTNTKCLQADLVQLGVAGLMDEISPILTPGESIGVIGGPPCQGFSRSNVGSRSDDPRNKLPSLYLDIVAALQQNYNVEFILFENVLGIRDRKHKSTFDGIKHTLGELGLSQSVNEYCAFDYGVPQQRQRIIIAAFASPLACRYFSPTKTKDGPSTVREAIGYLPEPAFFSRDLSPSDIPLHRNHWTMKPRSERFSHPDVQVSDGRSFRRLRWEEPSPTVAYGHREIHVHPNGHRRLSIYEAMLLQGFPNDYVLCGTFSAQVQQVSNAVPPPMARAMAAAIEASLDRVRHG